MSRDETWVPRMGLRDDWLARTVEDIIDPEREIVDPHHHLWVRAGLPYEMDHLWRDTGAGHNVVQTIFIECRAYYDETAEPGFESVGETRTVAGMAQMGQGFNDRAQLSGIVCFADLRNPDLDAVLDAHIEAGQGLVCGLRQSGARDAEPQHLAIPGRGDAGLYGDAAFRRGMAHLADRGLTYDTWHYHHQADDFLALVRAVPQTTMVLDHFSTPLGVGRFEGQRDQIFARWKDDMAALADCPNVIAKLGGLAMPDNGWNWHEQADPPTSDQFVEMHGDWYRHMIAVFGPERCMFESNFPVDRISISYPVLWNGFKKIAAEYDADAQQAMLCGTARRIYGLQG